MFFPSRCLKRPTVLLVLLILALGTGVPLACAQQDERGLASQRVALRLAIEDLIQTYGADYPQGR